MRNRKTKTTRDPSLIPFDRVAVEYSLRNPQDQIDAKKAQKIGMIALWKVRREMKKRRI